MSSTAIEIKEPTSSEIKEIKFAQPRDITQIVAFGYKTFEENSLEEFGLLPDFTKMLANVADWVINDAVLVKRNKDDDRLIDGVIALQNSKIWWSEKECLAASLFYITPEKRSFTLARDLLKAAQEYAIMYKVPLIVDLVDNREKSVKLKQKLLRYLGFIEVGSLFIFNKSDNSKKD